MRAVAVQVKQQGTSVTEQLTASQKQTTQLQVRPHQLCSCLTLWRACIKSVPGRVSGHQRSIPWHTQGTEPLARQPAPHCLVVGLLAM